VNGGMGWRLALRDGRERAAVECRSDWKPSGQLSFEPAHLVLEFGDTDRLTLHERFVNRSSALTSAVVTHVRSTVSAHGSPLNLTGYATSVTSGYVTWG
jgi:hypothetical protein